MEIQSKVQHVSMSRTSVRHTILLSRLTALYKYQQNLTLSHYEQCLMPRCVNFILGAKKYFTPLFVTSGVPDNISMTELICYKCSPCLQDCSCPQLRNIGSGKRLGREEEKNNEGEKSKEKRRTKSSGNALWPFYFLASMLSPDQLASRQALPSLSPLPVFLSLQLQSLQIN